MKVVLDTNCLVQIILGTGYKEFVWNEFFRNTYTLCFSNEILFEYEEVLLRLFHNKEMVDDVLSALVARPNVEYVGPSFRFSMITADPDDNKFVDCAITCGATYIVSDDHHYNELKRIPFPPTYVKKLKEFADILKAQKKKKK